MGKKLIYDNVNIREVFVSLHPIIERMTKSKKRKLIKVTENLTVYDGTTDAYMYFTIKHSGKIEVTISYTDFELHPYKDVTFAELKDNTNKLVATIKRWGRENP